MKRILISFLALCLTVFMFAGLAEPVFAEMSGPVAENLELVTYRGVSVGGSLSAYDPDGDSLNFEITTSPVKGSIDLKDDGTFIYTPNEKKHGRDYFGYKAVDAAGNYSQEATVIIKIEKQKKGVSYSDMHGRADEYAAIALSEAGLFTGAEIAGQYCFQPDALVSRGEFLSMCMLLSDEPIFDGVLSTGYLDDHSIPAWMKGYAATAAFCGIYSGSSTEAGKIFDQASAISRGEAAAMLDKALGITKVSYVQLNADADEGIAQACANLSACGLIGDKGTIDTSLTRSEAAQMLAAAMQLIARR